jgi:hypothetical protein
LIARCFPGSCFLVCLHYVNPLNVSLVQFMRDPAIPFFTQGQIYLCPVRVSIQHISGVVANPKKHYIFEYWRLMHAIFTILYPQEWSNITWMVNISFRTKKIVGTLKIFHNRERLLHHDYKVHWKNFCCFCASSDLSYNYINYLIHLLISQLN